MDHQSPIERYLAELDAELRLPARLRRRIVAEAREHLRESAGHFDAADTTEQMKAIESFGTPAVVAAAFARELAIGSTHRAARWGRMLFVVSLILWDLGTSSFVHVAPSWINDGPGSAWCGSSGRWDSSPESSPSPARGRHGETTPWTPRACGTPCAA